MARSWMNVETWMRNAGLEPTDAQKELLAHSHELSQKVFILPKHQGKSEAKAIARAIEEVKRNLREQG